MLTTQPEQICALWSSRKLSVTVVQSKILCSSALFGMVAGGNSGHSSSDLVKHSRQKGRPTPSPESAPSSPEQPAPGSSLTSSSPFSAATSVRGGPISNMATGVASATTVPSSPLEATFLSLPKSGFPSKVV
uniref:(northern house mosquito) hypothetical protein n=1 Tax=Culex pipiens TaxID=7175 RepID=A0A8D8LC97_CULPI